MNRTVIWEGRGRKAWRTSAVSVCLAVLAADAVGAIRYVNVANPTPAAPYSNWASAAQTIQDWVATRSV